MHEEDRLKLFPLDGAVAVLVWCREEDEEDEVVDHLLVDRLAEAVEDGLELLRVEANNNNIEAIHMYGHYSAYAL